MTTKEYHDKERDANLLVSKIADASRRGDTIEADILQREYDTLAGHAPTATNGSKPARSRVKALVASVTRSVKDKSEADVPDGPTETGLVDVLGRLGVQVRYNLRADWPEFKTRGELWERRGADYLASLRERIRREYQHDGKPLGFARERWSDSYHAVLWATRRDPFLDWLKGVPAWDGTPRLASLIPTCFQLDDEHLPLAEWAGQYVFLLPIARAHEPGLKSDEFPILIGPGGVGKSTFVRKIVPESFPEWYGDSLRFDAEPKTQVEALQGKVVVEVSEMTGTRRADIESMFSFISRQNDDGVRLSFRQDPESRPRRVAFVGTSNDETALPNSDNLRRFVPVYVNGGDPASISNLLDMNREQLWAEAKQLHADGVEPRLPDGLKPAQTEATNRARKRDMLTEDAVIAWFGATDKTEFMLADVVSGIVVYMPDRVLPNKHEVASVLREAGATSRHTKKGNVWTKGVTA